LVPEEPQKLRGGAIGGELDHRNAADRRQDERRRRAERRGVLRWDPRADERRRRADIERRRSGYH
jgi:hypothetical protein